MWRTGVPTVAILDRYAGAIDALVDAALPHDWTRVDAASFSPADQRAALRDADVALFGWAPLPAEVLQASTRLRAVHKLGVGTDKVDTDWCRANGVAVLRLGGGNAIPVAEHTVLLMLAALRRVAWLDPATRRGEWAKEQARAVQRQLSGKHVGFVGFGAIGREVCRLLSGFGVTLLYHDVVRLPTAEEQRLQVRHVELDELLGSCDVVTLHCPLTPQTRHLIGARELALMKREAVLVNCARGGVVDEAALVAALRDGQLAAAGLDVFESEPPADSPLLELDNVVVTPHAAAATLDNFHDVIARAVTNVQAVLDGRPVPESDVVVPPPAVAANA